MSREKPILIYARATGAGIKAIYRIFKRPHVGRYVERPDFPSERFLELTSEGVKWVIATNTYKHPQRTHEIIEEGEIYRIVAEWEKSELIERYIELYDNLQDTLRSFGLYEPFDQVYKIRSCDHPWKTLRYDRGGNYEADKENATLVSSEDELWDELSDIKLILTFLLETV